MWGMMLAAAVFALWLYVLTLPKKTVEKRPENIHARRWHIRDRDAGGYFIFVEVVE